MRLLVVLCFLCMLMQVRLSAQELSSERLFEKANLQLNSQPSEAVSMYHRLEKKELKQGNLFANLSVAYFKLGQFRPAHHYALKSMQTNPFDEDLFQNVRVVSFAMVSVKNSVIAYLDYLKNIRLLRMSFLFFSFFSLIFSIAFLSLLCLKKLNSTMIKRFSLLFLVNLTFIALIFGMFAYQNNKQYVLTMKPSTVCYSGPSKNAAVILPLKKAIVFKVEQVFNGWIKITLPSGKFAWCMQSEVSFLE